MGARRRSNYSIQCLDQHAHPLSKDRRDGKPDGSIHGIRHACWFCGCDIHSGIALWFLERYCKEGKTWARRKADSEETFKAGKEGLNSLPNPVSPSSASCWPQGPSCVS